MKIYSKIINVFTVTSEQCNASLMNKSINFFKKTNTKKSHCPQTFERQWTCIIYIFCMPDFKYKCNPIIKVASSVERALAPGSPPGKQRMVSNMHLQ